MIKKNISRKSATPIATPGFSSYPLLFIVRSTVPNNVGAVCRKDTPQTFLGLQII